MILKTFEVGPILENTYVVGDEDSREVFVVDPGGENHKIVSYIQENNLKPLAIICTHWHIDHIAGAAELQNRLTLPMKIHGDAVPLLRQAPAAARMFGMGQVEIPRVDGHLEDNEVLEAGKSELRVIHTPGHTPGGVCLLGDGFMLSGDTLFQMSIGRTDLPGGSFDVLMRSIDTQILTLPDETRLFSGHGPETSVGQERVDNPFLT